MLHIRNRKPSSGIRFAERTQCGDAPTALLSPTPDGGRGSAPRLCLPRRTGGEAFEKRELWTNCICRPATLAAYAAAPAPRGAHSRLGIGPFGRLGMFPPTLAPRPIYVLKIAAVQPIARSPRVGTPHACGRSANRPLRCSLRAPFSPDMKRHRRRGPATRGSDGPNAVVKRGPTSAAAAILGPIP